MLIKRFDYTPILGWSASRYDTFSSCKRQYFYQYYGKYDPEHSRREVDRLKALTSVPLEIGSIVHDVISTVLRRLQKSDAALDLDRFRKFVRQEAAKQCLARTFMEAYYKEVAAVSADDLLPKVETCLKNFLASPRYEWLRRTAIASRDAWIVEPPGYGEARLDDLKVYCKVDFLFPVEGRPVIVDWKTGKQSEEKHRKQLTGYAAWAAYHLEQPVDGIVTVIAYLHPAYEEVEVAAAAAELAAFREQILSETEEMYAFCEDVKENIPLAKDAFPMTDNLRFCQFCGFRAFCGR
jgi:CRISPR/Cas system-associated exonuclease Cas4 (RecB family)